MQIFLVHVASKPTGPPGTDPADPVSARSKFSDYNRNPQWHIFIILIVSCANVIVAPGNLSIVLSVGMEVYNSVFKFQRDCTRTSRDMDV